MKAVLALGALFAASLGDAATYVLFAAAVVGAVPFLRSRRKDAIIAELELVISSKDKRFEEQCAELAGAARRAEHEHELRHQAEQDVAAAQARYEEQSRYTAEGALRRLEELFATQSRSIERSLGSIEELLRAAIVKDEMKGSGVLRPADDEPQ